MSADTLSAARASRLKQTAPRRVGQTPASASFGLLGWAWIVLISSMPVFRFIDAHVGVPLALAPAGLLVLSLAAGHVRAVRFQAAWLIAAFCTVAAGVISGVGGDLAASFVIASALALLLALGPAALAYYATSEWLRFARTGFVGAQAVSAAVGILQAFSGAVFLGVGATYGRAPGLTNHPNVLGLMCVASGFILLDMARTNRGIVRSAALAGIALDVLALAAAGSLSNLVGAALGLAVYLRCRRATLRTMFAGAVGFVLLWLAASTDSLSSGPLGERFEQRFDSVRGLSGTTEGSLAIRRQTWSAAWDAVRAEPFFGVGMDRPSHAIVGDTVVHNYVLHYWYQGGLLLLIACIAITLVFGRACIHALRTGTGSAGAAIIVSTLAFALTSAFFDQPDYWMVLLFGLTLCGGPRSEADGARGQEHRDVVARDMTGGARA